MKKKQQSGAKSKAAYVVVLAIALIAAGIVVFTNSPNTTRTASAQSDRGQKKYRGTRRIVKDAATGEFRLPTDEEAALTVGDLEKLTKRPENLTSVEGPSGLVSINLEEGYAGTFIARPKADGTMETRCVFSLEEALDFLGLVEVSE